MQHTCNNEVQDAVFSTIPVLQALRRLFPRGTSLQNIHPGGFGSRDFFCKLTVPAAQNVPPGTLRVSKTREWTQYYHCFPEQKKNGTYIPKCVAELSTGTLPPSLALSSAPPVPLQHSFAMLASRNPFVFWDLCGIRFCVLKDVPLGLRGEMTG